MQNYLSPFALRKQKTEARAKRTLLGAGLAPLPGLLRALVKKLYPRNLTLPFVPTEWITPGAVRTDSEVIETAAALQFDTDVLMDWEKTLTQVIDMRQEQRDVRRRRAFSRLRQLISQAQGLRSQTLYQAGTSREIDFTQSKDIDFFRSTAETHPGGGKDGDGEACLSLDTLRTKLYSPQRLKSTIPSGGRELNALGQLEKPYLVILPGEGTGIVYVEFEIRAPQISGVFVDGGAACSVTLDIKNAGGDWERIGSGKLSAEGLTNLRFGKRSWGEGSGILDWVFSLPPGQQARGEIASGLKGCGE